MQDQPLTPPAPCGPTPRWQALLVASLPLFLRALQQLLARTLECWEQVG